MNTKTYPRTGHLSVVLRAWIIQCLIGDEFLVYVTTDPVTNVSVIHTEAKVL